MGNCRPWRGHPILFSGLCCLSLRGIGEETNSEWTGENDRSQREALNIAFTSAFGGKGLSHAAGVTLGMNYDCSV